MTGPDSNTVNTVLLVIVIPAIGGIWLTLIRLNSTLTRVAAGLTGVEGQGGALNEIRGLRRRTHRLESIATALLVHTGIQVPDAPGGES